MMEVVKRGSLEEKDGGGACSLDELEMKVVCAVWMKTEVMCTIWRKTEVV